MAKTKKASEKLTPIPKHRPRGRHTANDRQRVTAPPAGPDLSHIAAGLHALAVPIGDLQFDPAKDGTEVLVSAKLAPDANFEDVVRIGAHDPEPQIAIAPALEDLMCGMAEKLFAKV